MKALVEACGRQYVVEPGRHIDIDLTGADEGSKHIFDRVLMLVDGEETTIGQPYIAGAAVVGRVLSTQKSKKIIVYHMRPKKGTRKKQGHRQEYTRVIIDAIELNNQVVAKAEAPQKPAAKQAKEPAAEKEKAEKPKAEKPKAEKPKAEKQKKAEGESKE